MKFMAAIAPFFAAIASMSALWVAIIQRRTERKLKEAQISINYEQLATAWINRLQERIKSLEEEVISLKNTIHEYQQRLADAYSQMITRKKDIDV